MLTIDQWYRINTYMQNKVDAAKRAGENAITTDWKKFEDSPYVKKLKDDADDWGIFQGGWSVRKVDGTMLEDADPKDVLEAWEEWGRHHEKKVRDTWKKIENKWNNDWKINIAAPKTLNDKAEEWGDISKNIADLTGRVGQMKMTTCWTGKGAEAYGRIVPDQEKAVSEVAEMTGVSGNILYNASAGLQTFYMTIEQSMDDLTQKIPQETQADPNYLWYTVGRAADWYSSYLNWLETEVEAKMTNWWDTVVKAQELITDNSELDEVFKGSHWPESKSEGDITDAKPGPQSQQPQQTATPTAADTQNAPKPVNTGGQADRNSEQLATPETEKFGGDGGVF